MSSFRSEVDLVRVTAGGPVTGLLTHWTRGSEAGVTIAAHVAVGLTAGTSSPVPNPSLGPAAELFLLDVRTPQKPGADVGFVGKAHAAQPVQAITARLGVFGPGGEVDRSLRVVGDRVAQTAPPVAFSEMPITWQRTWAGDRNQNPLGVASSSARPANVFEQTRPQEPASFAPVPHDFPERLGLLGPADRGVIDALASPEPRGVRVSETFPFEFFHWAPRSQRLARIDGSEEIIVENLMQGAPRFRTTLPALEVRARIRGGFVGPRDEEIGLACDALLVDGDAGLIHLLFRAPWSTPRGVSLMGVRIEVALGWTGHPIAWIDRSSHPMFVAEATSDLPGTTRAISPEEAQRLLHSRPQPVPFGQPSPLGSPLGDEQDRTLPAEPVADVGTLDTEPPPPEHLPPELRPVVHDEDSVASTVAISPEKAAELLASRRKVAADAPPAPVEPVRTASNTLVLEIEDLKPPGKG